MLYPSIDSLLAKIDSKYSLVTVAAKRARAMLDADDEKDNLLEEYSSHKYVGKALEEIRAGELMLKDNDN